MIMTTISETLATDLLERMRLAHVTTIRQPDEFTAVEYAQANNMRYDPSAKELKRLVENGTVTRRKIRQIVYYRFVV